VIGRYCWGGGRHGGQEDCHGDRRFFGPFSVPAPGFLKVLLPRSTIPTGKLKKGICGKLCIKRGDRPLKGKKWEKKAHPRVR